MESITQVVMLLDFNWYINSSSPHFDESHMTFQLVVNMREPALSTLSSYFVCFSISIRLARPCIMWPYFASSHPDFNPCTSWFYFFQFNFWMSCKYNLCLYLFSSYGLLLGLLTMRPSSHTYTHALIVRGLSPI